MRERVWRKSSKSPSQQCLEMAHDEDDVLVRDSKQKDGPVLRFPAASYSTFIQAIRADVI